MPHGPRSASQEGFEHSPITSTRCKKYNVSPGKEQFFVGICRPRQMTKFEPRVGPIRLECMSDTGRGEGHPVGLPEAM